MGQWGYGLYSGDFALDLRSTITALVRLPFSPDRITDILCESGPSAANDATDEDHATFWLVIADQFAKRGLDCEQAREKALAIIDAEQDIAAMQRLGMKGSDLAKKRKMQGEIRARITALPVPKTRKVLSKPQPFVMNVGQLFVYPTSRGKNINPYFRSKELESQYKDGRATPWTQDGWAAMLIVDCGRAFDYLAWYRAITLRESSEKKASAEQLLNAAILWRLGSPGTCSPQHYRKLELEKIATLPVSPMKLRQVFGALRPGISAAVSRPRETQNPWRAAALRLRHKHWPPSDSACSRCSSDDARPAAHNRICCLPGGFRFRLVPGELISTSHSQRVSANCDCDK